MKVAIKDADELVRKRGGRWTLVTRHPLVKLFFRAGGDYEFLARHPDALATSTGGNEVDWELDGDVVVLSHQLMKGDPCRVDRGALIEAVARLGASRQIARPRSPKKTASKKAHALAKVRKGTVVVSVPGRGSKAARSEPGRRRVATR